MQRPLCNLRRTETVSDTKAVAAEEFGGGHGTFAGGLELEDFERSGAGAHQEAV
jgi:hypothetical protein